MRLPEGEVVFLMTVIVGSSALAEADQELYLETIGEHDSIVAQSVSGFGGHLIKHRAEGNSLTQKFSR